MNLLWTNHCYKTKTPGTPPTDSSCAAKPSWDWGLEKWGTSEVRGGENEKVYIHCKFIIINLKVRLLWYSTGLMLAFQDLDLLY
jgi:hypothetical protein